MTDEELAARLRTVLPIADENTVEQDTDPHPFVRKEETRLREQAARWAKYDLPVIQPLATLSEYAEANQKRVDLVAEISAIEQELRTAVNERNHGLALERESRIDRQVSDILAGRADNAFNTFEELNAKISRLSQRLAAYDRAWRTQMEVVTAIRSECSIDAVEAVKPAHRGAVGNIVKAIDQLRVALDRETAIRHVLSDAGYDVRLPSFGLYQTFGPDSPLSDTDRRAREYTR
jgi:molecular chaperone GrpE (heat shock protein)